MDSWLLDLVACPHGECGGALARTEGAVRRDGTLRCRRCEAVFPVLGGIPLLVTDPAWYLGAHHDAVLAALAEAGLASRAAMSLLDDFGSQAGAVEPRRFGDDWTRNEGEDVLPAGDSAACHAFGRFLEAARHENLTTRILSMLPERAGPAVEVGSGAGALARALCARADHLVVIDLSLRAALRSASAARRRRGARVAAVVADAEALPLARRKLRTIVSANLVDLLERPGAFVGAATSALAKRGRLVVCTPAPELGMPTEESLLIELLRAAGLEVRDVADGVPWVRAHGARHFQVYFAQVVSGEKR